MTERENGMKDRGIDECPHISPCPTYVHEKERQRETNKGRIVGRKKKRNKERTIILTDRQTEVDAQCGYISECSTTCRLLIALID